MLTKTNVQIHLPGSVILGAGSETTGFSVEACGKGSFTGLSYTIPAHAKGKLEAAIQIKSFTSQDMKELNDMVMTMLSATAREDVKSYEKANGSANLSIWRFWSAGAEASYEKNTNAMKSSGLSQAQIDTVINRMFDMASQMSRVKLDFTIDNSANDYNVSGDLQLYTLSGEIKTAKGTQQFRVLADKGTAGGGAAPAEGKVIPLS